MSVAPPMIAKGTPVRASNGLCDCDGLGAGEIGEVVSVVAEEEGVVELVEGEGCVVLAEGEGEVVEGDGVGSGAQGDGSMIGST